MNLNFYAGKKFNKPTFVTRLSLVLLLCVAFFVNSFAQAPGTGLQFDGSNDYVNVPNNPVLNISNEITIEAWVNYSKTTGTQDVVSKSSSTVTNSYIFPRTEDGWRNLQFWINLNGQGAKSFTVPFGGSSNNKRNQWHHLAATFDGFYMKIYIDGVLAGSQAQAGNITVNSNALTIGNQKGQAEYFGGKLDDIRIWNRALTACEIANTMSCELNAISQNGLAAYYKFNQGVTNADNTGLVTATDETSNQNDGTLTNFALTGATSNWTDGIATGTCAPVTPIVPTAGAVAALLAVGSDIELLSSGGDSYSWTGPNGFTSNQQNPVIPAAGANRSGTYTVTVTKNGCSATASVTITVTDRAKALTFDGTDDVVRIPNAAPFNPTTTMSIEMWIKPTRATPLVQNVLTKSSFNQNNGYIFPRTDDGWQSFSFWLAVNGQWKVISAQFGNLNKWTHVAATYDGFFMKIYMDGNLVSSLSAPGTITVNSNDLQIGQQPGYSAEFYQGGVDEMRVWSRSLTQCEIQNNLTCEINGANNGLAALSGLSAYYRFNQGLVNVDNAAYTTLIDSSANHNNGTLINFTLNGTASNWTSGGNVNNGTCTPFVPNDATASSNGPIVEVGQTLALQASAGSSWSWTGPLGFTSSQQNPTIPNATVDRSGTYTVTVTGNGCSATASTNVQVAFKAGTLSFDGADDYAIVPANSSLDITKEITMEAWIYPTSTARPIQDVMGKSRKGLLENDNLNTGYIFPRTDDSWGSYVFYLHLNGVWQKLSAPYPGINQWHHVAATYDGYYMRIYLDGRLSASKLAEGSITVNSNDLYLGWQQGFDEYFQGKVDEARLWNRALNQCEIINNMNCELAQSSRRGLVAYFQFNQGFVNADNSATSSIIDASVNGNNASLQNFALNGLTSNWSDFKVSGTCGPYTLPPVTAAANGSIFGIGSTIKLFSTGGDTYTWEGPAGFTAAEQNPTIVNAQLNQSGVYTVTAPFVNCVVTASTRLSVSALSPIAASGPTTFCPSGSVTLSTPNNGSAYQWFRDGVAISDATNRSYTATVSGNYTVSVTTGKDVLVSEAITVTVEDNLAPQPTLAQLPVLNLLTPATVTTVPTATDNCAGLISATTTSPLQYNDKGSYVIHWVYDDHNGHVVTQDQQVEVTIGRDVVAPVLTLPTNITLPGDASTCGAIATFAATATDNSGDPVTITYSQLPNTLFAIGVTTVHVTATDATGNATSGDFTVTVTPVTVAPISGILTVCAGAGSILSTPSASTGGTWSSSNPAIASVEQNGNVTGNAAGTVTITFTNNCGVSTSTSFTVNAIPATPVVNVIDNCGSSIVSTNATGSLLWNNGQTTPSFTIAAGGLYSVTQTINGCTSAAGSATAAPKAIPAAPSVVVSNNCGNSVLTATGQNLAWSNGSTASAITVADAATYTVTQTVNGCISPAATVQSAPVAIPAAPSVTVSNNCADAVLSTNATGTLAWSNGATGSSITVSLAGNYSVTQTVNGCTSAAGTATAAPKGFPAAPAVSVNNICGSSILTASGSNLQWSNGSSASSITVSNNADYQVTQTVNGCTSPAATVHASPLAVPATPVVTVQNNCGSTILSTNATGTLAWSTMANTSSIVVSTPGSYGVTQTVGGCTSASGFGIAAPLAIPAPPVVTVNNNCGNALLTATGSGLVWSTGETTAAITVSNTNNYSVTQTVGGCTSQPAVVAGAPKAVPATPVITVANFCGYSVLSTVSTESIRWTNNATTASISTTTGGDFGVTVTGANGCSASAAPVTVSVNAIPVVPSIGGITSITVGNTTQLSNTTPGGTWSSATTGVATVDQNGLVTGTGVGTSLITYKVTSTAGCSTSVTTLITVAPNCVAPSFTTFPSNITVAAGANCAAAVTYLATAVGSPAPALTYDFSGATILAGLGTGSGANFNKGVTTVRITASNACGLNGTTSRTFTVTVSDLTAPVFTPVADVTACAGAAAYTVGNLTASDNCSAVTISYTVSGATTRTGSGGNASGAFNTGVSTVVYTMKDAANNVSYDTVTVTINPIPVATFTAAANEFCSQTVINGSSSTNTTGTTYKWMYGSSVVSNSAQLSLGLTNGDGNYQLFATANGCTSAPATYTYAKQNLLSSYTILVSDDASLGKYNKVVAGSVGALNTKTDLRFRSYSSVTGPGSFVKGTDIRKDFGAVINNQVYGVATVTLPEMQYNTASTKYLPSYTAYSNNSALAGNFNSLTIKRNVSVTLTGNTFGTIRLEEGASVAFTANVLNIENLYVDKGVKNNTYSYVRFAPNSSVRVSTKVSIGSEVLLNPEGNKVTFYMGDQKCDNNERFTVKGGDTRIIANVIMLEGKLSVNATDSDNDDHEACDHKAHYWWNCSHRYHEHDDCDHKAHNPSTCSDDVYMTGLFIVEDLDSKGNTVIWSSFDCSAPATVVTNSKTVKQSITQEGGIAKTATTETSTEDLKVTVLPNPSTTFFTLKFESRFETPITLKVMDASGRVVDAKSKIGANSTLQVGHSYPSGTYFAEIVQGNQRKVVQLIKARG
jgi:hypothetical protein